jgi:hypothetical protein
VITPIIIEQRVAAAFDFIMCAALNGAQLRRRIHGDAFAQLETYVTACEALTLQQYYDVPHALEPITNSQTVTWSSPVQTATRENNTARVELFFAPDRWNAPTVLMLHAFMSATDIGYRRLARRFNQLGWNAAFVHLPYHYSRRPRGFISGELAITADLVRTAEALRQSVIELRQLMRHFRARGCPEFGIWATSYGGWIGALLSCLESDFRFVTLMSPLVNLEHAIWSCKAAVSLRAQVRFLGISPEIVRRHAHLSSPLRNLPLCPRDRIMLVTGSYDQIVRMEDMLALHEKWSGSELLRVRQGHFGYRAMRIAFARLRNGFLPNACA